MSPTHDSIFPEADAAQQSALLGELAWCNPFLERRAEVAQELLGRRYRKGDSKRNLSTLVELAGQQLEHARPRFLAVVENKDTIHSDDAARYQSIVFFYIFHRQLDNFQRHIDLSAARKSVPQIDFFEAFVSELRHYLPLGLVGAYSSIGYDQVFSVFFQIRRAFHFINAFIAGGGQPLCELRGRIWQSIFTHDMDRYQRVLCNRMGDLITLINGSSGTGKELVARSIGLSRYIPYDTKRRTFAQDFRQSFFPVNLSALSSTLIESELFGHCKGSFTGALQDRKGYFESCGKYGTVFLDEIGETSTEIQVKLLRVLQTRTFTPIGHTDTRHFTGKLMAATNRDLAQEIQRGRFREDFYYRLCADRIQTPPLRAILQDDPGQLDALVRYLAEKFAGTEEAERLTEEALTVIRTQLGSDYPWPGNFRELEQCLRNIIVHGEYQPALVPSDDFLGGHTSTFADAGMGSPVPLNTLIQRYVTQVYNKTGSYEEAARLLNVDRRTVKKYVTEAV